MPSPEHQVLVDIVRTDPEVVTGVLAQQGDVRIPPGTAYRVAESTLSELKSVDFHVDLALTAPEGAPPEVENVLLEVQLSVDTRKPFSWPVYVSMFRREHKRGAILVVLTTEQEVVDWIGAEIPLSGDGSKVVVHVIGPAALQPDAGKTLSQSHPAFAVMAGLAHAAEPGSFPLVKDALEGLQRGGFSAGTRQIVYDILMAKAHEAVRRALEQHMDVTGYEWKSEVMRNNFAAGREEGLHDGLVRALTRVLNRNGVELSAEQLARVKSCTDEAQLESWLDRAVSARAAQDLFVD